MATRTGTGLGQPNAESPDASYAIVAGLYVAVLLAPLAVLVFARATSNGGLLYLGFLTVLTVIATVVGWTVSRTSGLAVSLGGRTTAWLLVVLPFIWFIGVFGVAAMGTELPGITVGLAIVSTIGGMFLGLFLTGMSRTRYAAAVLIGAEDVVEWEARWPRRWRHFSVAWIVIASVLGVGGVIVQLVWSDLSWAGNLYFLMFLWTPFAGAANPRTFRVTDVGLVVERPLQQRLRPWSEFESYAVTDTALIIHPSAWWRPAYRSDREDVEDLDAAVEALEAILGDDE
ncbi:hypothetical protein [Saliphagus sp. LR7]|uniref:hypothetical protein n=1 Tax=Saliphagus sp. LR7 TaxID=2282654 RepID=UPI0018E53BE0|nr:hypothetical protein [Saliphagus sp. LR7]